MSDVKIQSCYTTYMSKSITKWRTKITYEYLTKSSPYDSALLYVHQQFIHICKCLKLNVFLLQHQCFTDSIKHRWCKVMAPLKNSLASPKTNLIWESSNVCKKTTKISWQDQNIEWGMQKIATENMGGKSTTAQTICWTCYYQRVLFWTSLKHSRGKLCRS